MRILPLRVETIVLDQGLKPWDADTVESLFEGITEWKEPGNAKLNMVTLAECSNFDELLSSETKTACGTAGVKLCYSIACWRAGCCDRIFEELGDWEERPWIEALKCRCQNRW